MLDASHDDSEYEKILKGISHVGISPNPFWIWQSAAEQQAKLAQSVMATNQAVGQVWLTLGQQSLVAAQRTNTLWLGFFLPGLK